MVTKIEFKDLSIPLKSAIIVSWIVLGIWITKTIIIVITG